MPVHAGGGGEAGVGQPIVVGDPLAQVVDHARADRQRQVAAVKVAADRLPRVVVADRGVSRRRIGQDDFSDVPSGRRKRLGQLRPRCRTRPLVHQHADTPTVGKPAAHLRRLRDRVGGVHQLLRLNVMRLSTLAGKALPEQLLAFHHWRTPPGRRVNDTPRGGIVNAERRSTGGCLHAGASAGMN